MNAKKTGLVEFCLVRGRALHCVGKSLRCANILPPFRGKGEESSATGGNTYVKKLYEIYVDDKKRKEK